ncbi:hypothetical protein K493DRAFT_201927 [Basidiobolus meristosporus CBS 931.73]|uniref:Protein FAM72 n=1 Tax=Basidiobolus meristosporus CBS 931.73 TaxID=1314790 RepID=A0A1Y1ZBW7_9FUNG|nr:hypothetical protein K493DRAFT_201927 [Basidiobolus meristosporus CBS 931.73]|eukprot:ORY07614.1 hypothetical protein K493DRAFT_201927 [Basidiobolus meristosporus CBS 931.73]
MIETSVNRHQNPGFYIRDSSRTSVLLRSTQSRPGFDSKPVFILTCRFCENFFCERGMKAVLLADCKVELYSTDAIPWRAQGVGPEYLTEKCGCSIRDVACLDCGNVVGYNVTSACPSCLSDYNNGHYWIFHSATVKSMERLSPG